MTGTAACRRSISLACRIFEPNLRSQRPNLRTCEANLRSQAHILRIGVE